MTKQAQKNISRVLTWAVGTIFGMIAVALPVGYFLIQYQNTAGNLEAEVEDSAEVLSQVITENPDVWEYQQIRYIGYLSQRPSKGYSESRRIINKEGKVIADKSDALSNPLMVRSADLYDSGTVVGMLEISRSLRPLLLRSGVILLVVFPLSLGAFLLLRMVPLRAISIAEESLKASEARFRRLSQEFNTILDATSDSMLLVSRDLRIIWANKGSETLAGGERTDVTGKNCYEVMFERSRPCSNCYLMISFYTGKSESATLSTPRGRLLEARAFPIREEGGNMDKALVVLTDVTDKTALRSEALRASHLASLGELAAGVAHEVNNPINGIINYAQILLNRSAEGSKASDVAGRIIKEGERIAGIVGSLLSFARQKKDERSPISLRKTADEAIRLLEAQLKRDSINLAMTIPDDLPAITANPQQIQQVILNLISNARYALNLKYSEGHEYKNMSISAEALSMNGSDFVRMTFTDQGAGIPADILNKVADPFFSTKPSGLGTGLGLSISHGIIKDHGGRLMIESEEGIYTSVVVDLPVEVRDGK